MDRFIEIRRYNPSLKKEWDDFVESSKNGTFLFKRDYMDYHSDRFEDNSYMIYRKEKLYCLLPANRSGNVIFSHQGLTYGGLVMNEKCTMEGILEVFEVLIAELRESRITEFSYKPVPYIYSHIPSEEDLYALFRKNASLIVRNVSSAIKLPSSLRFQKDRREAVRRALRAGLEVKISNDFPAFWKILEENLKEKYDAAPVHSLEEIIRLKESFPNNIMLWAAYKGEQMMGGVVCYNMNPVVHAQYISASPEGKKEGVVDLIIQTIIGNSRDFSYLDLGTSNESAGRYLNSSLIYQKEGFGGRAVCYDTYKIEI